MNKNLRGDYGNAPNTQPTTAPRKPVAAQPKQKPIPPIKQR